MKHSAYVLHEVRRSDSDAQSLPRRRSYDQLIDQVSGTGNRSRMIVRLQQTPNSKDDREAVPGLVSELQEDVVGWREVEVHCSYFLMLTKRMYREKY